MASDVPLPPTDGSPNELGIRPSDPEAVRNAYRMGDWSIPQKHLTTNAQARVTSRSTDELTRQIKTTFRQIGLQVAEEETPSFAAKHPVGTDARPVYGYIVGEAGLTISQVATGKNRRQAGVIALIGIAVFGLGVVLLLRGPISPVVVTPGMLILIVAVFLRFMNGPWFESQLVSVRYWGRLGNRTGPVTGSTEIDFQIEVHAGRLLTVNRAGGKGTPPARHLSGPAPSGLGAELSRVPARVLADLGTAPSVRPPG